MNYHVINCPDDIDMGYLHWKFNSTCLIKEDNPSGVVEYGELRPGQPVRMKV